MTKVNPINKSYIKQKSFWLDSHNKKMAELGERMLKQRQVLDSIKQNSGNDCFQRIDGTIGYKKYKNPLRSFFRKYDQRFADSMNQEYKDIKREITDESDKARRELDT